MTNQFEIKRATRAGIKPLIVAYSESGCGKTMSSLLLARGLAGPNGKITVADSESRRASLYADVIPGGFDTFDLAAPYSPARYCEAIDAIEESGAAVGVIDSGSHQWEGPGGVLDMAAENELRSGKTGLHNWKVPKFEHAKFVARLMRAKIPLVICLRAKYKTRQVKENGKTVIVKDDATSPIQADDFIFEATCHFEILQNHSIILTKCSHPALRDCFPKDKTTPITIEHGQLLAAWCANAGGSTPATKQSSDGRAAIEARLWGMLKSIRKPGSRSWDEIDGWLIDNGIISDTQNVKGLTESELLEATDKAKIVLDEAQGVMP